MGCWNGTCAVSNLHVMNGQKVAVFMLLKNSKIDSFCYTSAMYDVVPVPFYGNYNDYGAVENCHGFGLPIVLAAIKERLYEFGTGANEVHDIAVNKDNFDIEMLFEADHEDRLGIQDSNSWSSEEYQERRLRDMRQLDGLTPSQEFELDRLANKIKKVDTFRRLTHVIIHGDVFDDIMNKWYIEDYVGEGKGNFGYKNSYTHIYFTDIEESIPEYVAGRKKSYEEIKKEEDTAARLILMRLGHKDEWGSPNLASKWLRGIDDNDSPFDLISVSEYIREYENKEDWDGLSLFLKEVLTASWVNSFMAYTRKAWTKQIGAGSQNSDELGYRILLDSMTRILDAEKSELDDDEDY